MFLSNEVPGPIELNGSMAVLVEHQGSLLNFQGPVSFRNRQRRAETLLSQFRLETSGERIQTVAEYSHLAGFNRHCAACQPLLWPGKHYGHVVNAMACMALSSRLGHEPVDTERSEIRRVVLTIAEIALITGACILGLALATFFLTFNIIHRHER